MPPRPHIPDSGQTPPDELSHLLAPGEEVVWTGRGHPRFPILMVMGDSAYLAMWAAVAAVYNLHPFASRLTLFRLEAFTGFMVVASIPLFFCNLLVWRAYYMSSGSFYACTSRRHLILKRRMGATRLDAIPRRHVEYIGVENRSLILYYDYARDRSENRDDIPRGYLDLDDAQAALAEISATRTHPLLEPPEPPRALHIGDLPYPPAVRDGIQNQLEEGEELLYTATPGHHFGLAQVLGLLGMGIICWLAYLVLEADFTQDDIDATASAIRTIGCCVFGSVFLLIAYSPIRSWRRRSHSIFILTNHRACELDRLSGKTLQTWEAAPDLIKKATLRRNGRADFLFSLDHTQTSRSDAANKESGVEDIPDARKLISIINTLPER